MDKTLFLCILLIPQLLVNPHHGQASDSTTLAPAMFLFGDSLIDSGNNNYIPTMARANYFPYGIDFGYPTGRFCNGLTAVDFAARKLGLPLIPPYLSLQSNTTSILNGVNYASAAAGILEETGQHYGARITLSGQVSLFESTIAQHLQPLFQNPNKLNQYIAKSIFLINIGSNDYINNYLLPSMYESSQIYDGEAFADLLINKLSEQLSKLYKLGARKMVLAGLAPLGCIPSQLSLASDNNCIEQVNELVTIFNSRLIRLINTLNASLPGLIFVYENIYNLFNDMVNNAPSYGFLVADTACCGNGRYGGYFTCLPMQQPCAIRNQHIFWDSFHPTQAVNAIIAESCNNLSTTCYPMSIDQLAQL